MHTKLNQKLLLFCVSLATFIFVFYIHSANSQTSTKATEHEKFKINMSEDSYIPRNNAHSIFLKSRGFKMIECLILGDSIVEAMPFLKLGAKNIFNAGVPGIGVEGLNPYIKILTQDKIIKNAIIHVGVNDCGNEREVLIEKWKKNYIEIINTLVERGAKVFISTIAPITPDYKFGEFCNTKHINELNNIIKSLANDKIILIDTYALLATKNGILPRDMGIDGVHLSKLAYKKWYDYLEKYIATKLQ